MMGPRDAYWLGFLLADGHLRKPDYRRSKSNRRFALELAVKDIDHVDAFLDCYDSTRSSNKKIKRLGNKEFISATTTIVSTKLPFIDLDLYDKFKNGNPIILESLTNCLFWHCVRGIVDGDGHIAFRKINKRRPPTPVLAIYSPHRSILDYLNCRMELLSSITKNTIKRSGSIYGIQWSGTRARNLMALIYRDIDIALNRKWKIMHKCMDFVSIFEEA